MRTTEPYTIFPRTLKSGKIVYYYQFRDKEGRRSSAKSTGCTTLSQAKRYCQKLYNTNKFSTNDELNFKTFTQDFFIDGSQYLSWTEANGHKLKPETIRSYQCKLDYQLLPYFQDMKLKKITTSIIKEWIVWAVNKWSAKTVNNAQGVLNIILESALEKEIIDKNPLHNISYRDVKKKNRVLLTTEELNTLYHCKWAKPQIKQAFLLTMITGMRIGEVCCLKKTDIKNTYLDVTKTWSERYGEGSTKTDVCRCVPFPSDFNFPESKTEWVFEGKNNKPLMPHCVYNGLIRNCERLGINTKKRGITLHSLRNFFISYMQGKNVPLQKIKAVVGHADETMTDHYTYWTSDMYQEVYTEQKYLYEGIIKE